MPQTTVKNALSQTWLGLHDKMLAHVPGTIAGGDIEELHRFRVALRKTRALLKLFEKSLPDVAYFVAEFHWLSSITGPVRDLDVLLQYAAERLSTALEIRAAAIVPLIEILRVDRIAAQQKLQHTLVSARWRKLATRWQSFLTNELLAHASLPALDVSIRIAVNPPLLKQCIALLKNGARVDSETPASTLHHLRIRGKRTRYLLDTMRPFVGAHWGTKVSKQLIFLQDVLGQHQDAVATIARLNEIKVQLSPRSPAQATLQQWIELLQDNRDAARAGFATAFSHFAKACRELE
jgi:CHAD domain-containing protein